MFSRLFKIFDRVIVVIVKMRISFVFWLATFGKKIEQKHESFAKIKHVPLHLEPKTTIELEFYCSRSLFLVIHTTYVLLNTKRLHTEGEI